MVLHGWPHISLRLFLLLEPERDYGFNLHVTNNLTARIGPTAGADRRTAVMSGSIYGFQKTKDCPASEDILAMLSSEIDAGEVCRHLAECEFCAAELELYRHYPVGDETVHIGRIPEPLRELAEALLHGRPDVAQLNELADR